MSQKTVTTCCSAGLLPRVSNYTLNVQTAYILPYRRRYRHTDRYTDRCDLWYRRTDRAVLKVLNFRTLILHGLYVCTTNHNRLYNGLYVDTYVCSVKSIQSLSAYRMLAKASCIHLSAPCSLRPALCSLLSALCAPLQLRKLPQVCRFFVLQGEGVRVWVRER